MYILVQSFKEDSTKAEQNSVLSVCFMNMPHGFRKLNLLNITNLQNTCFEFCYFLTDYLQLKRFCFLQKLTFRNIAVLMAKCPMQDISRLLKQTISLEFQINLVIVSVNLLRAIVEADQRNLLNFKPRKVLSYQSR